MRILCTAALLFLAACSSDGNAPNGGSHADAGGSSSGGSGSGGVTGGSGGVATEGGSGGGGSGGGDAGATAVSGSLSAAGKVLTLTLADATEFEPGNGVKILKDGADITEDLDKRAGAIRVDDTHAVYTFDTENVDTGTIQLVIDNTELARETSASVGHNVRCSEGDASVGTNVPDFFSKTLEPADAAHPGLIDAINGVYRAWLYRDFQTAATTFDFASTELEADIATCIDRGKTYFMSFPDRTFSAGTPAQPLVKSSMLTSDPWVCVSYDSGGGGYELARWRTESQTWELGFFRALRDYLDSLVPKYPTLWDHFGGIIRGETATGLSPAQVAEYGYDIGDYMDRLVETQAHLVRLFRDRCFVWQEFNFLPSSSPSQRNQFVNRMLEAGVRLTGPDIIPAYPNQVGSIADDTVYDSVRGARKDSAGKRRGIFGNTMEHNSYRGVTPMSDKLAFALTPVDQSYAVSGTSLQGLELDAVFWWGTARWNPPDFTFYEYANGTKGADGVKAIIGMPVSASDHDQILWRDQASLEPLPDQTLTLANP